VTNLRRPLAVVYLLFGAVLAAYAFADPVWGFPSCLVLAAWLIYVAVRCFGPSPVASLVKRTAWVYLGIALAGVALMVWHRSQGTGGGESAVSAWVSFPTFLSTVTGATAFASWLALARLGGPDAAPARRSPGSTRR